MKKIISIVMIVISTVMTISGCEGKNDNSIVSTKVNELDFNFNVDPETFGVTVDSKGVTESVSKPLEKMKVSNLKNSGNSISWDYEDKGIDVNIEKKDKYLDVSIKSNKEDENKFTWPKVTGEKYMLPLNEGKYIPNNDEVWKEYLSQFEFKCLESLSMQFFAAEKKDYSIVYIIKNPYNNGINFETKDNIEFNFTHEYPSIKKNKEYGFRIYLTEKNPVDVAKIYKNYIVENGDFKTLKEKEKENKNISKLYGAPHIYFWDSAVISEENINWSELKNNLNEKLKNWIQKLLNEKVEDGKELAVVFDEIKSLDYVDKYNKNRIVKAFSSVLQLRDFYNPNIFSKLDNESLELVNKGLDKLNNVELIELNKRLLKGELGNSVDPIEKWANANTVDVIDDMKKSGIEKMWVGLDDWEEGFTKPELVKKSKELGYLIGTYDSYHSIHKPGEEKWATAKFTDTSLYENATVTNKDGKKIGGFKGEGRKLNPTLAMPSVKERVSSILNTGLQFNSWFLDTDGTGEVYDDYSPKHITTEAEDVKARLERIEYLQKEWNLVVGTEGGNDFVNKDVAFAHGIETPSFSWMDNDMNKNKESEYYVGRYYSSTGGVPEMFAKQIPIKDKYKKLFLDTAYTIPLYKLVYNDSVITTHWWGWGTLKFKDEVKDRMLYEVLYNVPPLYHIDKNEWKKHKERIVDHTKVWSKFSEKVINKEMTDFEILSEDKLVQMTKYGDDIKVIANFSEKEVTVDGKKINPKSLIIIDGTNITAYTPQ